jgi:hypothetical protein
MLAFGEALKVAEPLSENVEGVEKKTLLGLDARQQHSGPEDHAQELAPSVRVAHLLFLV